MNTNQHSTKIIDCFQEAFATEPEDPLVSSFWDEHMVMIADEALPHELRMYAAWNEYSDRIRGEWLWHAPTRVFRLPTDTQFLLAQKTGQCLSYDTQDQKIKLTAGSQTVCEYNTLLEAISSH